MHDLAAACAEAYRLLVGLDASLLDIVALSLRVSLTAVAIAAAIALPLGALMATSRFPGRGALNIVLNALMGLPPVVVGLVVYMAISRSGPLGALELLYTPGAMILAQAILVTPIVASLTRQAIEDLVGEYGEQLRVLGLSPVQTAATLLWEGRQSLATAILAGFGRAIAEVGAVLIVGGNIEHVTRTMTTAITLETSKGNLPLALGLGIVLLALAVVVNAGVMALQGARTSEVRTRS